MSYNIFHIGKSGADAAQFGIRNAAQNVSNVNTEGYHRRTVQQAQANISSTAVPKLGDGVRIIGAKRVIDDALDRRARDANSEARASLVHADILARANVVFGDIVDEGLSPAFDGMLASFDELASTPQDPIARNAVLDAAELFAAEVRRYGTAIQDVRRDIDSQLKVEIDSVNSLTREIAEVNRLVSEEVQPNPDLLDRRDQLVSELADKVELKISPREDGTIDVHIVESGYTLVAGRFNSELDYEFQPEGIRVVGNAFGGVRHDLTDKIKGGAIGGILVARDGDLASAQSNLDDFVFAIANEINWIHSAGFGADGISGRNLFAAPAQASGSAVRLQLDAAVVDNPDAVGAAQNAAQASGDNGVALELAGFRYSAVINGDEPPEALQGLLQDFGDRVYRSDVNAVSRSEAANQLRDLQQSMSGVSLDEEMSNLVRYQQAYQAAVRVMQTADELMQELMLVKR